MELSYETVRSILERHDDWQWCSEYGEPGYNTQGSTPLVVLGDYWCRCDKFGQDDKGRNELHTYESHHPKVWEQMVSQGVEFEWCDEWTIDYDNDKAYRTEPDSYSWQPCTIYTEHGDLLTPDDDLDTWLEVGEYVNNPEKCLTSRVFSKVNLIDAGWESYNGEYQSGWHEGMTDDPKAITTLIRGELGDSVEILFLLDETSQFYIGFSAWTRKTEGEDE